MGRGITVIDSVSEWIVDKESSEQRALLGLSKIEDCFVEVELKDRCLLLNTGKGAC